MTIRGLSLNSITMNQSIVSSRELTVKGKAKPVCLCVCVFLCDMHMCVNTCVAVIFLCTEKKKT